MGRQYSLLLQLATERLDTAARALNLTQTRLAQAKSKVQQLETYLHEYRARSITRGQQQSGILGAQWMIYRQFIERLVGAIALQQGDVQRCQQAVQAAHQVWLDMRRQLKAMEVLVEQEARRVQLRAARLEQKQTDEWATQAFYRREEE